MRFIFTNNTSNAVVYCVIPSVDTDYTDNTVYGTETAHVDATLDAISDDVLISSYYWTGTAIAIKTTSPITVSSTALTASPTTVSTIGAVPVGTVFYFTIPTNTDYIAPLTVNDNSLLFSSLAVGTFTLTAESPGRLQKVITITVT
jgi:hypothetical protein